MFGIVAIVELFQILKTAWNEINDEYLKKLVECMGSRCKAVIKSKGMPAATVDGKPFELFNLITKHTIIYLFVG